MLVLLTDAHISPNVAAQVKAKRPACTIYSVRFWRDGALLNAQDDVILAAAREEGLALVTYDQRTIVPLVPRGRNVAAPLAALQARPRIVMR